MKIRKNKIILLRLIFSRSLELTVLINDFNLNFEFAQINNFKIAKIELMESEIF